MSEFLGNGAPVQLFCGALGGGVRRLSQVIKIYDVYINTLFLLSLPLLPPAPSFSHDSLS